MKKLLLASATATMLLASAPAFAAQNQATDNFDITANVAKTCTIGDIQNVSLDTIGISTTAGSGALLLNSGSTTVSTAPVYVSCNDTNTMTVVSQNGGKLVNSAGVPAGSDPSFTNQLWYSGGAANYVGIPGPGFAGPIGNGVPYIRGAIAKQVHFDVVLSSGGLNSGKRPISGTYSDTITVTVATI